MTAEELTSLRRADRALPDEAVRALLARAAYGFTATSVDGQPYQHTSLFWFDDTTHRIYLHGARQGRLISNVQANPRVCFTVAEIGRLLPAKTALDFSNEYTSAVVFGRATLIDDPSEKGRILQALLDKYFPDLRPGRDYRPITPEELAATAVYAIQIDAWSGKQKKGPQE
jgi:nitroimidazol reductase NimA-like FMN-containing flavoprotein (pyridoxamine 5'-phosphate oxidase superfamily)